MFCGSLNPNYLLNEDFWLILFELHIKLHAQFIQILRNCMNKIIDDLNIEIVALS